MPQTDALNGDRAAARHNGVIESVVAKQDRVVLPARTCLERDSLGTARLARLDVLALTAPAAAG